MYKKGYRYWHRQSSRRSAYNEYTEDARFQHKLWSSYLQAAGGLRELLVADTRSVHPGLWNDRWELPWPYVRRHRAIQSFPKICMSGERAAAEAVIRIPPFRAKVFDILDRTSSLFGYEALITREHQEHIHRFGYNPLDPII